MPARKISKRRVKRAAAPQFLVVRGAGSSVMIARVQFTAKKASLARALDRHRGGKGIGKAKRAFILMGIRQLYAMTGINLGQHGRPGRARK